MAEYFVYYRVSTERQGRSGLGLEAQRTMVEKFLTPADQVIAEFTEIQIGKRDDRAELWNAISFGKKKRVELGEHGHAVVQAVGRGATRGCSSGKCLPGDVYIIAAAGSGIEAALRDWFPGATVKRWYPANRPTLTGKVAQAATFIKQRLKDDPVGPILFQDVMDHIGCRDRSNFNRTVRGNELFKLWLSDKGLVEVKLPGIRGKANAFQAELPLFAAAGVEFPPDVQGSKI